MAAPARQAAKGALEKGSFMYKFRRWAYYKSYFPQLGLRRDDAMMEVGAFAPILQEALRRLPQEEIDARHFRLYRAHQLMLTKTILPKEEWTDFDTDTSYLKEYIEEVEKEMKEREEWNSM